MVFFHMKLKKFYLVTLGYSREKAAKLKEKIYTMPSADQRQNVTFRYSLPKCCIKYDADMLKNLCKATRFDYDTHDCTFNL